MRTVIAVVAAGLIATLVDNFAAWRLFGEDFEVLSKTTGRYVVAIAGAALLPFIFRMCGAVLGALAAYIILAGGTAFLAMAAFSDIAPPHVIFVSTSIYAVTAIFVFLMIASGGGPRRDAAARQAETAARAETD